MGDLPGPVRLLVAGTFVNKLGTFILPYLAVVLQRDLHLTAAHAGLLMGAFGFGSLCSVLAGGWLTDALGRKRTLSISLLGSGALAIAMAFTRSLPVFATVLVVYGFLGDLYRPAASAVIGDLLPSGQRAVGFAALRMSLNLGFAFGMVLGGVLADFDWRLLFVGDGLTTMAYGAITTAFLPETRPAPHEGPPPQSPWRDPVFLQMMAASFLFSMAFFCDFTVFPLTVAHAGYPSVVYGALVGVNGLLIAIFEVSLVDAFRRLRRLRLAAAGALLTGAGFSLLAVRQHWLPFLLCVLVWTAGEILAAPQQSAFVTDWAPPPARGRYLATFQASWVLALAVNPPVALPLYARLGDRGFWPLVVVVTLVSAALLQRLDRIDRPENLRGLARREPQPA